MNTTFVVIVIAQLVITLNDFQQAFSYLIFSLIFELLDLQPVRVTETFICGNYEIRAHGMLIRDL